MKRPLVLILASVLFTIATRAPNVVVAQVTVVKKDCFANSTEAAVSFPAGSVSLGVLMQSGGDIGTELEALVRLAAFQVNSNPSMLVSSDGTKRTLCILSLPARLDPFSTFQAALKVAGNNVTGVIGPMWTSIGDIVAPLANKANIPFISPAAFTTAFHVTQGSGPDSNDRMPYLRRICCNNTHTAKVIIDILNALSWKRVALLVTDTDYGHSTSQQFSALARRNGIVILTTVFVPPEVGTSEIKKDLFDNIKKLRTRIIVNFLWDKQMFDVLQVANESGLVGPTYGWLFAELIMERAELQAYIANDTARASLFEGVLFTHLASSAQRGSSAMENLRQNWPEVARWYPDVFQSDENNTVNTYALLTYDATMLYAIALNKTLSTKPASTEFDFRTTPIINGQLQLPTFVNGSDLLSALSDSVQNGPSGQVRIDVDGAVVRDSDYSVFNAECNGNVTNVASWKSSDILKLSLPPTVQWHGCGFQPPDDEDTSEGQTLRVLVPRNDEPFIFYDANKTGSAAFTGFAIDLLKYFAEEANFKYELHLNNDSWDEMVQRVGRPDTIYDMAIGDITVTAYRELVCDFTSSFFQSNYRILVKRPDSGSGSGLWQFFDPFSYGVWLMLLLFLIFSGGMLYFLEHWHLRHVSPGLAETLWVSFSTFYSTQKAEKITSNYGRFYLIVACFIVMVINAAFTANMTSFLLDNDITLPYSTLQQVGNEPVGALAGTATWRYLKDIQHQNNLVDIGYSEAVGALTSDKIKVFINNEPSQKYLSLQNCSVAISGDSFHQEKYAFALKRSSPMRNRINSAILNAWDSGYIEDLYYRRFVWNDPCKAKSSDTDALKLSNVGGLFIIVAVAAVVCLIGHFTLGHIQKRRPNFGNWSLCMDTPPPLGEIDEDNSTGHRSMRTRLAEGPLSKIYTTLSNK
eukprot:scpid22929/ scgid17334/ Glutamate receptor 3.5; Ionotropic glutamate receptor GLR6; Ligand-gated ion channel 3.5